ncbi:MAG: NUDIX domain-containing protein [Candidatus Shapirobacteria bacterium]
MDELLVLVNENDEVIGEVWRSEANSNPKAIHREISILIHDNQEKLLLQQRSKTKKIKPGYWTNACAGHVLKDQSPEETAHKELTEELGFNTELKFIKKDFEQLKNETRFDYCYLGEYNDKKFILQEEEVERVKFFDRDEYLKLENTGKVDSTSMKWIRGYWEIK